MFRRRVMFARDTYNERMVREHKLQRVTRVLGDGRVARIAPDSFIPNSVQLVIDGTPQSHLNLEQPGELFFEYVRRMGHVIDEFRPPSDPITALHLGGGAYTIPRYIEATRPGSRQQVIELDPELIAFVREHLPLPKRASIRVRQGDARDKLDSLPAGLLGVVDLVVVDVFSGSTTPGHLTTVEFFSKLLPFLAPGAAILVNSAMGSDSTFARGQIAALQEVFGGTSRIAAIAEPQVLRGRRFGNVVLLAGFDEEGEWTSWLPRLMAGGPHPARLLHGSELDAFVAGMTPHRDATATDSPAPPSTLFGDR